MSYDVKNILIDLDNTMVECNIYYKFAKVNLVKYLKKLSPLSEEEITQLLENFELERLNSIDAFSSKTFPEVFVKTFINSVDDLVLTCTIPEMRDKLLMTKMRKTHEHKNKIIRLAESVFNSAPYTIYPTVNETLIELADRGYNCYIISKGDFYTQLRKIQDLSKVFRGVFIVPRKNKDVYSGIVTTIGSTPDQCVMVGDSPSDDIISASTAGLKTVWIRRKAKTSWVGDSFVEAFSFDQAIDSFEELLGILHSK